jgi:hypothetical protein
VSQKVGSPALVEALDGSGLYTEERNLAIWQQVPAELRLTEFSPRTLPDHPAFRWRLEGRATRAGFAARCTRLVRLAITTAGDELGRR